MEQVQCIISIQKVGLEMSPVKMHITEKGSFSFSFLQLAPY